MRTTVTLDDDTHRIVQARMERDGVGFKAALNDAIRDSALDRPEPARFVQKTHPLGLKIDLTHANAVIAELDNEAFLELSERLERDAG